MNRKLRFLMLCADLVWIAIAFVLAHLVRSGLSQDSTTSVRFLYVPAILVSFSIWITLYFNKRLEGFCGWHLPSVSARVIAGVFYLMGSLLAVGFLFKYDYSRLALFYLACLLPAGFIAIRCIANWMMTSRPRTRPKRRVVILGSGRVARELAVKISRHPELLMEVAGVLFPSDTESSTKLLSMPLGTVSVRTLDVLSLMQEKKIHDVIVVEPVPPAAEVEKLIANCRKNGMKIHLVPQQYELYLSKAKLTEIGDVPLLSLQEQTLSPLGLALKRGMDLLGALPLLVLSSPLLALSAGALRWKKGRAFRKELRCGQNEAPFSMYRLNVDRDVLELSRYERSLIHFSLTELPQLWNVLRGEMSLVGPRPESLDRVKHYSMWQRQRLTVTPGLTGLAQVNGLREQHSSEEKAHFDLQYIFHWSLFLDFCLLLQTAWTFLARLTQVDSWRDAPAPEAAKAKPSTDTEFLIPAVANADSAQSGAD